MKPTDHTAMESRRLASRSGHACGREAAAGNVRAVRAAITLLVAGGLLFAMAPGVHAALYKWTDDRGVIHYSDKMPPDALNRASVELNRDGTTVRKREQVKPVAQRAPKAFAITEKRGWFLRSDDSEAMAVVLQHCQRAKVRCWLYAVDDRVVWAREAEGRTDAGKLRRVAPPTRALSAAAID